MGGLSPIGLLGSEAGAARALVEYPRVFNQPSLSNRIKRCMNEITARMAFRAFARADTERPDGARDGKISQE